MKKKQKKKIKKKRNPFHFIINWIYGLGKVHE
jgi:hypothetical protein